MGSMYVIFVILVLRLAVYLILRGLCSRSCEKLTEKTKGNLFFNIPMDFIMTGLIDINFSVILNLVGRRQFKDDEGLKLLDDSWGKLLNDSSMYFFLCTSLFYPIWLFWFLKTRYDLLDTDQMIEKFGSAYEGLRLERKSSIYVPSLYMGRRFALNLIFIFGYG